MLKVKDRVRLAFEDGKAYYGYVSKIRDNVTFSVQVEWYPGYKTWEDPLYLTLVELEVKPA